MRAPNRTTFQAWLLYALVLGIAIATDSVWDTPLPSVELDPSWHMVITHAFNAGWQFGRDVVFTVGPWGFLYTGVYEPNTFALAAGFRLAVSAGIAFAMVPFLGILPSWMQLAALPVFAVAMGLSVDARWFLLTSLAGLWALRASKPTHTCLAFGLITLVAFASLAKLTVFVLATAVLLVVEARRTWKLRTFPFHAAVFAVAYLAAWLAAGQSLANLPAFWSGSFEMSRGFAEAMQISRRVNFAWVYLATSLLILGWLALARGSRPPAAVGFELSIWGLALFLAFKQGFVRYDGYHEFTAAGFLALACLATVSSNWDPDLPRRLKVFAFLACLAAAAGMFAIAGQHHGGPEAALRSQIRRAFAGVPSAFAAVRRHMDGSLQQEYAAALAAIRAAHPLKAPSGSLDVFGWQQAVVLAYGYPYQPRPVFQGYAAYTEALIDRNLDFIRSGSAPGTVLFNLNALDHRWPALDDAASWPELWTRYDVADLEQTGLRLERTKRPRSFHREPVAEMALNWEQWIDLPDADGLLWAEVDVQLSFWGKLASLLHRPDIVSIEVNPSPPQVERFRLVPAIARHGFLLSPLVESLPEFVAVGYLPVGRQPLQPWHVTRMRLTTPAPRWQYQPVINLRLYRLRLDPSPPTPETPELAQVWRRLAGLSAVRGADSRPIRPTPLPGTRRLVIPASAPAFFTVAPGPARALRVSFGLDEKPRKKGRPDAIMFRVRSRGADGVLKELWSRTLSPGHGANDRGEQQATILLPSPAADQLLLETLPTGPGGANRAYWCAVELLDRVP